MAKTSVTTPKPTATPAAAAQTVVVIKHDDLLRLLIQRSLERDGRGDVMVVDYKTDMLRKSKLRAAARTAFDNGLFREVRTTIQVNYNYDKKLQNRTDGREKAVGGKTWQRAVVVNDKLTPLTVHASDLLTDNPQTFAPGARAYLRYEPLTAKQRNSNFGKGDYSKYVDAAGDEIPAETVKPFYFDRKPQAVNHRTLGLANVTAVRFGGVVYQVR